MPLTMYPIKAKFDTRCFATDEMIYQGEKCWYHPELRAVFSITSTRGLEAQKEIDQEYSQKQAAKALEMAREIEQRLRLTPKNEEVKIEEPANLQEVTAPTETKAPKAPKAPKTPKTDDLPF